MASAIPPRRRFHRETAGLSSKITHVLEAAAEEGVDIHNHVFNLLLDTKRWADQQRGEPDGKPKDGV